MQEDSKKKFELPGSRAHYAPSLSVTVTHMRLEIEPDLEKQAISCRQELEIAVVQKTDVVELDAAELDVKSVTLSNKKLPFRAVGDRLSIKLGKSLEEGARAKIAIAYTARPRKGLYFVAPDKHYPDKRLEAWTQGETTEAKYWFPCIDHPQVKFSSEITVVAPAGYTAISNGRLVKVEKGKKWKYSWHEDNPHPSYLASVVVGKYVEINEGNLYHYVPAEQAHDAKRTFDRTSEMVEFFEDYLGTKYPFAKYSQVCVQDFVYGGMENSSCTTLTQDTLHDKKAHADFSSDYLVSHELAHQWFGDLVTCRDWQHVWLNEGFATYCEALYWEKSRGTDEFLYYVMQTADDYFEEAANRYMRPIVTKVYKHPDELFDRHTYEKAGCVLHMLRHAVGDGYFRRALKTYLQRFANGNAETEDLRRVFELETGKSLQEFFDQWLYRAGHPDLKVEFSLEGKVARIKVEQAQEGEPFSFPLEVRLVFSKGEKVMTFDVSEKESVFQVPVDREIEWFSIDPDFKVLKTVSIKAPKEMLIKQLQKGRTVAERAAAAHALAGHGSDAAIDALQKAVMSDFWGVAAEAAKSLGSIRTDRAFEALKKCLKVAHPKARRAVVRAIGEFRREEAVSLLKSHLHEESYFVESEAATAIGKTKSMDAMPLLKKALETQTFQNVVAQGAIAGLKEFADEKEVASILVEKSRYGNHHRVREAATFALGRFVDGNNTVVDHLKMLLSDKWFRVRINACRAFADAGYAKALPDLTRVAETDLDHRVRRIAEECINLIKEATRKPREIAQLREELDKARARSLEMMQRMDRLERDMR
ncbi:MAG: M1 family aminopeptidase [Nitrososphaera sp.]|uniref:M1 family aminopeptidase n=1 Tax=Nitrososphaera sp. TaxID=1971748 RepID=UPI0017FF39A3|nr:M1 family aminopeptidase [Nitrososphaera sp.]NWG36402.1 HEAT repeat domain-containing protein [Nitrososphaera sp.]